MTYCKDCGNPILENQIECQSDHSTLHPSVNKSNVWYLLPIFIGFVGGGIIMYFVLRNENYEMAWKGLCVGITLGVIKFSLFFLIRFSSLS